MKLITVFAIIGAVLSACKDDPYCGACPDQGTDCIVCWDSFYASSKCNAVTKKVDNCMSYVQDGVCIMCINGYYVDSNGKCAAISDKDCLDLDTGNTCGVCKQNIPEPNKLCANSKVCSIANCDGCNKDGKCEFCKKGYIASSNSTCVVDNAYIQNCKIASNGVCQLCDYQYHPSNGKCVTIPTTSSTGILGAVIAGIVLLLQ